MNTKLRISTKAALFLVYLLLVVLIVVLLVREESIKPATFFLTSSHFFEDLDSSTLVVEGENLHPEIKAVLAKTLVNEDALLWHQFTDVFFRVFDVRGKFGLFSYKKGTLVSGSFSEKGEMQLQGTLSLPGDIRKIKIIDNKALVSMSRRHGLSLVEISDPENLKRVKYFPTVDYVNSIVTVKNSFYYTGYRSGVFRLDLDTENPVPEKLFSIDSAWRMTTDGKRLAVGTLKGVVALFEIDKAGRLVDVGRLDFQNQVRGVVFTDEALSIFLDDGHVSVYSLSNWPNLTQPGRLLLPAEPMDVMRVPRQERVVASLVSAGFGLVDVSPQKAPVLDGWYKVPKTYRTFDVTPEKILGTSLKGLEMISIEKLESGEMSKLAPEAMMNDFPFRLRSWRQSLYGVDSQGNAKVLARAPKEGPPSEPYLPIVDEQGVTLYKQAQEGQLVSVGSVAIKEAVLSARLNEDYLYVALREGLRVFHVKSPGELIVVGDLSIPGLIYCFELLDSGTAMVATRDQGVVIVDVSEPAQLQKSLSANLTRDLEGSDVRHILVDGQRAYLTQGISGVNIVDISSPQHPEMLQLVDTPGFAMAMALHDDLLFVADRQKGLFIVDVKDPEGALPVGSLQVPIRIRELAIAVDGLMVSTGGKRGATMKLPLPQRLQGLRNLSESETRVDLSVAEKGQYLYLYDKLTSDRVAVDLD